MSDKQHAHELLDRLEPVQVAAVVHLLEIMVHDDDSDELSEADRRAVTASREYFRKGGEGVPFEQVLAECGLTMDQIRGPSAAKMPDRRRSDSRRTCPRKSAPSTRPPGCRF